MLCMAVIVAAIGGAAWWWHARTPLNTPEDVIRVALGPADYMLPEVAGWHASFQKDLAIAQMDERGRWAFAVFEGPGEPRDGVGYAICCVRKERKGRKWQVFELHLGVVNGADAGHVLGYFTSDPTGELRRSLSGKGVEAEWRERWQGYLRSKGLRETGDGWQDRVGDTAE